MCIHLCGCACTCGNLSLMLGVYFSPLYSLREGHFLSLEVWLLETSCCLSLLGFGADTAVFIGKFLFKILLSSLLVKSQSPIIIRKR